MSLTCTRCQGTGFLNIDQVPPEIQDKGIETILVWIRNEKRPHDVQVCDCCGDGESWHGEAGEHYNFDDPPGPDGPYAHNGGLCECH